MGAPPQTGASPFLLFLCHIKNPASFRWEQCGFLGNKVHLYICHWPLCSLVSLLGKGMWPGLLVRVEEELWGRAGLGQDRARVSAAAQQGLLPTFRSQSHAPGALIPQKPMGSPCLAASLLAVLLLPTGLSAPADTGCGYLPPRITRCLLASHMVRCHCWERRHLAQVPALSCAPGSPCVSSTVSDRSLGLWCAEGLSSVELGEKDKSTWLLAGALDWML